MVNLMLNWKWQRLSILVVALAMLGTNVSGQDEKPVRDKGREIQKDAHGDPLPEGARVRMGTLRWRHPADIQFVGFISQNKQVLTSCVDGFFRVWDTETGKEIRKFGKPQVNMPNGGQFLMRRGMRVVSYGMGSNVALSADRKILAETGMDGVIRLWDVANGKEIRTLTNAPKEKQGKGDIVMRMGPIGVSSIAFSPNGKVLATKGMDQVIHLWDLDNGKEIRQIGTNPQGPRGIFYANSGGNTMTFLGDGKTIATVGMNLENGQQPTSSLRIFEVASGKELREIKSGGQNVFMNGSLAAVPNTKTLAWATTDGTVGLYDAESGKEIRRIGQQQQNAFLRTLLFSPDGKIMATQPYHSPVIHLWDVAEGKELRKLGERPQDKKGPQIIGGFGIGGMGSPTTIAFSSDGKTVAEATSGNSIRLWKVDTGKEIMPPVSSGHHGDVNRLAVSADGKVLTTFAGDQTIRQWDMATGKELRQTKLPATVANVALTDKLAAWGNGNRVTLWDVAQGKEARTIDIPGQQQQIVVFPGMGFGSVALSPNNELVAIRGLDQVLHLYDTKTGKEFRQLVEQEKGPPNPNGGGGFVAMGVGFGRSPMAFSADGTAFASVTTGMGPRVVPLNPGPMAGGPETTLRLWNLARSKNPRLFETKQAILELAVSPDAHSVVTANGDNSISVWEALTGKECLHIKLQADAEKPKVQPPVGLQAPVMVWGGGMPQMFSVAMALSRDGRIVAVAMDRNIRIFDLGTGKELGQFKGHEGTVVSLAFAADNRTLISGSADTTALVWDAGRFLKKTPTVELKAEQVDQLWKDLAGDPLKAYQAIQTLSTAPKQAVALVKEKIKPAPGVDDKRIDKLIADLESDKFLERQKATKELEKFGELAEPALQKSVQNLKALEAKRRVEKLLSQIANDQTPSADVVRALRAVQVLGQIGTPEARTELERLAKGAAGDKLTRSAEGALRRLKRES
jgi:WD40 repeat protein